MLRRKFIKILWVYFQLRRFIDTNAQRIKKELLYSQEKTFPAFLREFPFDETNFRIIKQSSNFSNIISTIF